MLKIIFLKIVWNDKIYLFKCRLVLDNDSFLSTKMSSMIFGNANKQFIILGIKIKFWLIFSIFELKKQISWAKNVVRYCSAS